MKKSLIVWLAFSALIVSCDFIKKQGNQNKNGEIKIKVLRTAGVPQGFFGKNVDIDKRR